MKYYVLLSIKSKDTNQFIEVGLDYNLSFHPNLTDVIVVADYPCKINEIYYDLDCLDYITLKVEATDRLLSMNYTPNKKQIHRLILHAWRDLKEWTSSNNKQIILNDYSHHPEEEFNEEAGEF